MFDLSSRGFVARKWDRNASMGPTRCRNLGSEHLSESWVAPRALVVVASLVAVVASLVAVAANPVRVVVVAEAAEAAVGLANPVRVVGSMVVVVVQDCSVVEGETAWWLHFRAVSEPELPVVGDRRFS